MIIVDNGSEFCDYELVVDKFNIDIYFVNLYFLWECGLNENFNGLLCQYICKGMDLRMVMDKQVVDIECVLNVRFRKCLGYKQFVVVFNELCNVV